MKVQWCWRCKANVPMLEKEEWEQVWDIIRDSAQRKYDPRPPALAAYQRFTGFKETDFNNLFRHRVSIYGSPCTRCGKVLRTPVAYKCFECGFQVRQPNESPKFI